MFNGDIFGDRPYWAPKPKATITLVILNIVGLFLSGIVTFTLQMRDYPDIMALTKDYAIESLWLWQFLSYGFVFCCLNSWTLIFFMIFMYVFYIFGREIETVLGSGKLVAIYLGCQVVGGFTHIIYQYLFNSSLPAYGNQFAGAMAIICTAAFMWPDRPIMLFFVIPVKMIVACLIMIAINVFLALVYLNTGTALVASLGAVAASFIWFKTGPRLENLLLNLESASIKKRSQKDDRTKREVDRILEKISKDGMGSLTKYEVKLLKKASKLFTKKQL